MTHTITLAEFRQIYRAACSDWKKRLVRSYGESAILDQTISITDVTLNDMREQATPVQTELLDKIFGKAIVWKVGQIVKLVGYVEGQGQHWTKHENDNAKYPIGFPMMIAVATKSSFSGGMMVRVCTLEGLNLGGIPDNCIEPIALAQPTGNGHCGFS